MAFLTESQLRSYAGDERMASKAAVWVKKASREARLTIFLSHSHLDATLVKGLINYLASEGVSIYVDWNDTAMPRITGRDTANRIKVKIRDNALFVILATANALSSRWVPWETGVADQVKTTEAMLVIPVADPSGRFQGNEYLQLYKRMVVADDGKIAVFEPGRTSGGVLTESFLRHAATL